MKTGLTPDAPSALERRLIEKEQQRMQQYRTRCTNPRQFTLSKRRIKRVAFGF